MKLLGVIGLFGLANSFFMADECPHDLEVRCIDDINKVYPICEKAAQEKGKDIPADLDCMKYATKMEKDCWPCICWIAEQEKWKIKGCDNYIIRAN